MQLDSLSYYDQLRGWQLSETKFHEGLTLLVGISGVGKTQILSAVSTLRKIAEGNDNLSLWGTVWEIAFRTTDGIGCRWSGEYEMPKDPDSVLAEYRDAYPFFRDDDSAKRPRIIREKLVVGNNSVIERSENKIFLNGSETVKLSPVDSALHLLREETAIGPVAKAFEFVLSVDQQDDSDSYYLGRTRWSDRHKERCKSIADIRALDIPTRVKLSLVYDVCRDEFDAITNSFSEIFPHVTAMKMSEIKAPFGEEFNLIQIQEKGVDGWIPEYKMSSGMRRTLLHLARMRLVPDGMLILIDEIENSLGVNCINEVTQLLLDQSRRLQFVVTSHHPYIINNVDTGSWKLVKRTGGKVAAIDVNEKLGRRSAHEAFLQLLNMPEYEDGIGTL